MQNIIKYLHRIRCGFYVLISAEVNFLYTDMRKSI